MANNIQIVQQCYADFGNGNIQGILDSLSDNVRWIDPGAPEIPFSGIRNGKEEVLGFFTDMAKVVTYTHFEPQQFYSDGNAVFVKGIFTGKGNETGKPFQSEWAMLWEVVDGKVTYFQAFSDTVAIARALVN